MSLQAFKYETETGPAGRIELTVPIPAGTRVEVLVVVSSSADFMDLTAAAGSSTDFWDNPLDDEDWNSA